MAHEPAPQTLPPVTTLPSHRRFEKWVLAAVGPLPDSIAFRAGGPESTVAIIESPAATRRYLRALLLAGANSGLIDEAAPVEQPGSLQPIAGKLFGAYQVDGGHLQLAGCQLEDHLVCRCAWNESDVSYFASDGKRLSGAVIDAIKLDELSPRAGADELNVNEGVSAIEAALEHAESTSAAVRHVTLIQCRHAAGKIRFTIGSLSWDLPFSGWANAFTPPPFHCPHTGVDSFHIAATDDGRIAAAEEIAVCRRTGRRLLKKELAQCAVTGAYVLPEYAVQCPVTSEVVEQGVLVECTHCRQLVSPHAIQEGQCRACRTLAALENDDPRRQRMIAEHPGLAGWRNWRLAETADAYILEAQGLWQRLLAVLDRQTLHCRHMAIAQRWPGKWRDLSVEQAREILEKRSN